MTRQRYEIKGRVQGVGFRPFFFRIATKLNLKGFIKNSSDGVVIELNGDEKTLNKFEKELLQNLPPLAKIDEFKNSIIPLKNDSEFVILSSDTASQKTASVLPDIAICHDCLRDIEDESSNYFGYFATNCTNCGTRYSIIKTVPYDRKNTSMSEFKLCKKCEKNYNNPLNRRYHAQPIGCSSCGPQLELRAEGLEQRAFGYRDVANLIKQGKIGAIKGVGGFHIVCDATNHEVVQKLREYKNRPTKPFALMFRDLEMIKEYCVIGEKERELLTSKEAPIVILKLSTKSKELGALDGVAPFLDRLGCFLPYTALHHLLFKHIDKPIVATSANLGGEPIITDKKELEKKLPFLEFILDYNREIVNAVDDSVVQVVEGKTSFLRVARGYTPFELKMENGEWRIDEKILALGANQKSTIALYHDRKIVISPYIGDLDNIKSIDYLKRTIETFKRFYDFEPDVIVCDKHPNYESTKLAKSFKKPIFQVQHHLAHLYSVMAEHSLSGDFVGFIFDGTGYGDDGILWGGEVFVGDERRYHFKPIKLIGGEKAIKEPKRVALSMLFEKYSLEEVLEFDLPFSNSEIKLLHSAWSKELNCPNSSSVGRLFDGVASLTGLLQVQTYEGEAGLLCEMAYDKNCKSSFDYTINNGVIEIEFNFFDKEIVSKFINTLVSIMTDIAKKEKLPVILSGGVFQNKTLLSKIMTEFQMQGIEFYTNEKTSTNDQSVALGQVYYYLSHQ